MKQIGENRWECWAHDHSTDGKEQFRDFGHRSFVDMHGGEEPIVRVILETDPEGPYWGWMDKDDTCPCMIFGSEMQFRVCFPYGLEAEVKAGKGNPIRLRARRAP